MLVFAKLAYDSGRHFDLGFGDIVVYGVGGLALGAMLLTTASIFGAMPFVMSRYVEISLPDISTSVVVTGLLASLVYQCASFS